MPEMAGEFSIRGLLLTLGLAGALVMAFCVALTLAARRFPPRVVWVTSGALVVSLILLGFGRLYLQPFVRDEIGMLMTMFFFATMLGLPSAAAVAVVVRRAARPKRAHILLDFLLVSGSFVFVVPIAAVVAAIPDLVRMLS